MGNWLSPSGRNWPGRARKEIGMLWSDLEKETCG
jgi:hypothetical protein